MICAVCGAEFEERPIGKDNIRVLCRACRMAETLDAKAKKLSRRLADETDPGKIYMQLLAWTVEVAKCRG